MTGEAWQGHKPRSPQWKSCVCGAVWFWVKIGGGSVYSSSFIICLSHPKMTLTALQCGFPGGQRHHLNAKCLAGPGNWRLISPHHKMDVCVCSEQTSTSNGGIDSVVPAGGHLLVLSERSQKLLD